MRLERVSVQATPMTHVFEHKIPRDQNSSLVIDWIHPKYQLDGIEEFVETRKEDNEGSGGGSR